MKCDNYYGTNKNEKSDNYRGKEGVKSEILKLGLITPCLLYICDFFILWINELID